MKTVGFVASATFAFSISAAAFAQSGPAPYGPNITAEQAQVVLEAAVAEAQRNNWTVSIAIVENSGELVLFKKANGTQYGSTTVSMSKARSAAMFRRPTKAFAEQVAGGNNASIALPGAIPIEGGVPIIVDGSQIGAIGVSGVTSVQDGVVAGAGAAALQ